MFKAVAAATLAGLAACTAADGLSPPLAGPETDRCGRTAPEDDRRRFVVVSHPFSQNSPPDNQDDRYAVWALETDGALWDTGHRFRMGRAFDREIRFSRDGTTGFVAQDDGSIGVFQLDADGAPRVVHAAWRGSLYARDVVVHPEGTWLWVIDGNFRPNGGGVYRLTIACDGVLSNETLITSAKAPRRMAFFPDEPDRLVLAAQDVLTTSGTDTHLLDVGFEPPFGPEWLGSTDVFRDPLTSASGFALTRDARFALLGASSFGPPYQGVVTVDLLGPGPGPTFPIAEDPAGIVVSPWNNAILVAGARDNALWTFTYDSDALSPFGHPVELETSGGAPELPFAPVVIDWGPLTGLTLVAENQGIRRIQFEPDGQVIDLGLSSTGADPLRDRRRFGVSSPKTP